MNANIALLPTVIGRGLATSAVLRARLGPPRTERALPARSAGVTPAAECQ